MLRDMSQRFAPDAGQVELAAGVFALDCTPLQQLTVEVVPGVVEVPRYIPAGWAEKDHDYAAIVSCAEDGPSCLELTVRRSVTGEVLRSVPVTSIVRGLVWRNLLRVNPQHGSGPAYVRYEVPEDLSASTDGTVLRTVAEVYQVAAYVGDAPRLEVARALSVSRATADRRIRAAREAGLLDLDAPVTGRGGRIYPEG